MSTTSGGIEVTPGFVPDEVNGETITWDKISRMIADAVLRVQAGSIGPREVAPNSLTADQLATDLSAQLGVPAGSVTLGKLSAGFILPISQGGTGAATAATALTALGLPWPYLHVRDEKSSGTNGQALTASAWTKRNLIIADNLISGASLASDVITLPAGTYLARGWGLAGASGDSFTVKSVAGLFKGDSELAADLLLSGGATNIYLNAAVLTVNLCSIFSGRFVLTEETGITFRQYSTSSAYPAGYAANIAGFKEYFADVEIWKIG